jgi:hypothetical protein
MECMSDYASKLVGGDMAHSLRALLISGHDFKRAKNQDWLVPYARLGFFR